MYTLCLIFGIEIADPEMAISLLVGIKAICKSMNVKIIGPNLSNDLDSPDRQRGEIIEARHDKLLESDVFIFHCDKPDIRLAHEINHIMTLRRPSILLYKKDPLTQSFIEKTIRNAPITLEKIAYDEIRDALSRTDDSLKEWISLLKAVKTMR